MTKEEYSLVVVLSPNVAEKDEVLKKVAAWVEETGAKVVAKENLGVKNLVYKIKGFAKGDFWELLIESEKPLRSGDFGVQLNREANVIRYLILKK